MRTPGTRTLLFGLIAGSAGLLWACGGGPRLGSPTDYQMWLHFEEAGRIQAAMIQGDLPAAREAANQLASAPRAEGIGPAGDAHVRELAAWARTIRDAPSFGEAAVAAGHLAATCGECHQETDGGLVFLQGDPPADRGFTGHMIAHAWAADRMWEGLLAPSVTSWRDGAEIFREEPLAGGRIQGAAAGFARRLHELGQEAVRMTDLRRQAVQYGRMIEQCAGCHAEMEVTTRFDGPPSRLVPTGR